MDEAIPPAILDKLTKVCTCRSITRATIKRAIENGHSSLDAIKKATGASTGACGGANCGPKIDALLAQMREKK